MKMNEIRVAINILQIRDIHTMLSYSVCKNAMILIGSIEMPLQIRIIPHVGINGLSLGIEKSAALNILGEPDGRSFRTYEEDGSSEEMWEYSKIGMDLTFSSDDNWLLGSISVESKDADLIGECFIGMGENEFLKKTREVGIDIEMEDDFAELGSKDYRCDKLDLSFWIQDGKLTSISIFPKYDESGNIPLWPE